MKSVVFTCLALSLALQSTELTKLEDQMAQAKKAEPKSRIEAMTKIQAEVLGLIRDDKLKSGSDFRRAEALIEDPMLWFEQVRVKYELLLMATKLGDLAARDRIPAAWDDLVQSLGRNRRFAPSPNATGELRGLQIVQPAPLAVTKVWKAPAAAAQAAKGKKNNPKIQAITEADQKDRDIDFKTAKPSDWDKIAKKDAARLKEVIRLVEAGELVTGEDYFNSALVCQHGSDFASYVLAHELSVCALILGYDANSSSWLSAASYDRMLLNMGHRQRFGTQSRFFDGKMSLSPIDLVDINDTMRFEFGRVKLSEYGKAR